MTTPPALWLTIRTEIDPFCGFGTVRPGFKSRAPDQSCLRTSRTAIWPSASLRELAVQRRSYRAIGSGAYWGQLAQRPGAGSAGTPDQIQNGHGDRPLCPEITHRRGYHCPVSGLEDRSAVATAGLNLRELAG